MERFNPDLIQALTNTEDGIVSMNKETANTNNVEHFKEQALNAVSDLPDDMPYLEEYKKSLENKDFFKALQDLSNLAMHIQQRDWSKENRSIRYNSNEIERIIDAENEQTST